MAAASESESDLLASCDVGIDGPERKWPSLTEDTLLKLQRNDPSLTALCIDFYGNINANGNEIDGSEVDWKNNAGACLGSNTHLKFLAIGVHLDGNGWEIRNMKCEEFYEMLADNRSIVHFQIYHEYSSSYHHHEQPDLKLPVQFYKKNPSLLSFAINYYERINIRNLSLLLRTLRNRKNKSSVVQMKLNCEIEDREFGPMIIDALRGYDRMRALSFSMVYTTSSKNWCTALSSFLQSPCCRIERLFINNNNICDEGCQALCAGLVGCRLKELSLEHVNTTVGSVDELKHASLKSLFACLKSPNTALEKLSLGDFSLGGRGVVHLASSLVNAERSVLKTLGLSHVGNGNNRSHVNSEGAAALAEAFLKNNTLEEIDLSSSDWINTAGWHMICSSLNNPGMRLNSLDLSWNSIGDFGMTVLGSAVRNGTALKNLDMTHVRQITSTGWKNFFGILARPHFSTPLSDLRIGFNQISDEVSSLMADALLNFDSLRYVDLSNIRMSNNGWTGFPMFLSGSKSLKSLRLRDNNINDDLITAWAPFLFKNDTLKEIWLNENRITDRGWNALSNTLFNQMSVGHVHASNHTLESVNCRAVDIPNDLILNLELNGNGNKREVSYQKILRYLSVGNGNIEELVGMKLSNMPHVISLIGRDKSALQLQFNILRIVPSLFDFRGNACSY